MHENNAQLTHFGVLGMKWGVRKEREYSKDRHGSFKDQSRDEDIHIKEGSKAYRVQSTNDVTGKGQTYISLDKLDHVEYITATAASEGGVSLDATMANGNDGRAYSVKLKLNREIVAPSYKKTMDAFIQTVDKIGAKNIAKNISGKEEAKTFLKKYGNIKVEDSLDEAYVLFAGSFMKDSLAKSMFFGSLKEQGYNAVVDEWDAQFGKGFTKTPLIVFDKDQTLSKTKADPLTAKDYEYFSDIYFGGGRAGTSDYFSDTRKKWDKTAGNDSYRRE